MQNSTDADPGNGDTADARFPFGMASWQVFVLVVLGGLVLPGILVYLFEDAGLPLLADLVWIVGYGTAVLVVWVLWIRPLDFGESTD